MDADFLRQFWDDQAADRSNAVVIDGRHYRILPPEPYTPMAGFGGHRFRIRLHDGRLVETSNLWTQGEIPDDRRTEFPDTAVFETGD